MAGFILAPRWFFGVDVAIDIFSLITLVTIAMFAYKAFTLDRAKKKYLFFSLAFSLLSISFFSKILSYTLIYYYPILHLTRIGFIEKIVETPISGVRASYILFTLLFSLFKLLHLLGLYLLYRVYEKKVARGDLILIFISFTLITYISLYGYFAFHILSLTLLSIISYKYLRTYRKNQNFNTGLLLTSFAIIAASHAVFIFDMYDSIFYVIAEVLQMIGFIILLLTFAMVLYNAKKKK